MTHTRQLHRRLIWSLLAGALLISIETPGVGIGPGLSNLHKVSDDLYRGAEPTAEGVHQLKELGIKTIIDLRSAGAPKDLRANSRHGLAAGR